MHAHINPFFPNQKNNKNKNNNKNNQIIKQTPTPVVGGDEAVGQREAEGVRQLLPRGQGRTGAVFGVFVFVFFWGGGGERENQGGVVPSPKRLTDSLTA